MNDHSIQLTSFNVNGLLNEQKRNAIFNKLRSSFHIILLQETHSTKEIEKKWKQEWGGHIIFSHGTSNSKGVAILFPKNLDYNIDNINTDSNGRLILIKIKINETLYNICNIYIPTRDHKRDQIAFANLLKEKLSSLDQYNLLIGGDFNLYLNPSLDKQDTMSNKHDYPEFRAEILTIMESFNLTDCWRDLNPNKRRYTWHARGKASRLDYWLISDHLLNEIHKSEIKIGLHSDHSIITLEIGKHFNKRGRGFWKLNNSLLHDSEFVTKVKNIIKKTKQELDNYRDKGLIWEIVKLRIRTFSIPYCIKKKKDKNKFKKELEERLENMESQLDDIHNTTHTEIYKITKKELENIEHFEASGHILRSKAKWTEEGEKNTSYFLNLEKRNYLNKTISKLEVNGKVLTKETDILNAEVNFYKTLYSEKLNNAETKYKDSMNHFLEDNSNKKLTNIEKSLCEKDITEEEILRSLKGLHNNRTPGTDGFPSEFYKFFWIDIKTFLYNSILYAVENGELSIEQKRGIITLIPKKSKNRLFLKNWSPISLLNTDYKIITKLLANRLKKVLPSIINDEQTGYLENRFIGQNIRLLEDISFFTKQNNKPGIILSIDFEKAFDSVNWHFLYDTLKQLNFGDKIISYIKTVYNNIESTVINNGNTSHFFKLERGGRQGCPLSAYLFIIIIETLANKIRSDPNIKGIRIDKKYIKISLLADDVTCILSDLLSLENVLKVLKEYQLCSGLKINIEKTQAKYIGSLKNNDYYPHGLSWIRKPLETLGIIFTETMEQNYLHNFKPKLLNLQNTLKIWKQRKLSLKGKITVLNSIALSPLI
jgi:exonuclease III